MEDITLKIKDILLNENYEQEDMAEFIFKLNKKEKFNFHDVAFDFSSNEEYGLWEDFIIVSTLMGEMEPGDYSVM